MKNYKQFDVIWVPYPFSDFSDKSKPRPALIVSNENSNSLDGDFLACQITSTLREDEFTISLSDTMIYQPSISLKGEIRCNKIATIRKSLIFKKIGELLPEYHDEVLEKIQKSFDDDRIKYFKNQQ